MSRESVASRSRGLILAAHKTRNVTLILGGARSGKSRYAQELASRFKRVVCIATAQPTDSEMRKKIADHRRARPSGWKTVEAPIELDQAIHRAAAEADVLLIDCLTVYAANVLMLKDNMAADCEDLVQRTCEAIQNSKASVIAVSNEVGGGVVPAFRSGRLYRDLLGQFNQRVAQIADKVILMVAGLPVTIKDSVGSSSR